MMQNQKIQQSVFSKDGSKTPSNYFWQVTKNLRNNKQKKLNSWKPRKSAETPVESTQTVRTAVCAPISTRMTPDTSLTVCWNAGTPSATSARFDSRATVALPASVTFVPSK